MKNVFLFIMFIIVFSTCSSTKSQVGNKDILTQDSIGGVYIPKDLGDCIAQLDSFWSDSIKNEIKQMSEGYFLANSHFGIGLWIRNNWGLWGKGSRLSAFFHKNGVYHPDDISAMILISYYRYISNKDIDFDGQLEENRYSTLINATPNKKLYPKGASKKLAFDTRIIYNGEDDKEGVLHIGIDSKKNQYWLYDYQYGWKKVDAATIKKIKSEAPLSDEYVKSFFVK